MAYFQQHHIKSIALQGKNLIIEYNNNSQTETKSIDNQELKLIQSYCQAKGLTSLSLEQLQKTNSNTQQPFNWTPWLIGGGIVLLVLIIGVISYSWIKKKQENKK